MPTKIESKYTLRDIWLYTYAHYRNRFDFRDRDVLKRIDVNEVKVYNRDRKDMPSTKYEVRSYSYPQYDPYIGVKGKKSKSQRKIKHNYESIFQFKALEWNQPFKWRVGSQRKWPEDSGVNFNQIKQLHSSVRAKLEKKHGKGSTKLKEAITKHKRKAKYLDKGDYISQVYGLNGDFFFRVQGNAFLSGNLYGMAWNKEKYGDGMPFFDKHSLRVVEYLLTKNIIKKK